MKKIDYCTYILSDGSMANIFHDETIIFLNRKFWKKGKIKLDIERQKALEIITEIDNIIIKEQSNFNE